jgi:hypothetical protein
MAARLTAFALTLVAALTAFISSPSSPLRRAFPLSASADSQGSEPSPAAGSIIFQDDFNSYGTAADILSAYNHMDRETGILLDTHGGLQDSQAMRINWHPHPGCADGNHLIERGFPPTQEIYAQFYVRYTRGFIFDWTRRGGNRCTGNAKKLFLIPGGEGSRLNLIAENHHIVLYEDHVGYVTGLQNVGAKFTPEMLGDGRWHRITLHARLSSGLGINDGIIEGWIDGVKRWAHANPVSGKGYDYFQTPTVFNSGSPVSQAEWMDNLVVWKPLHEYERP